MYSKVSKQIESFYAKLYHTQHMALIDQNESINFINQYISFITIVNISLT